MDSQGPISPGDTPGEDDHPIYRSRFELELQAAMHQVETARSKLVLMHLAMASGATPAELAEQLDLPLTTTLPILASLEQSGVIRESDGRFEVSL